MKKTPEITHRDERRELTRRSLIKWSLAAGAAVGLSRWKVYEILESSGGKALAADASCVPTNRSVHLVAGGGGLAWFQLLWPHNDVAASGNDRFAFHAPGQAKLAQGTDRPLTFAPETPWQNLPGKRQMSVFMAGNNETHTPNPTSNTALAGSSIFAVTAALQNTNPSVIPAIAVGDAAFGSAPGAPAASRVGGPDQIVDLLTARRRARAACWRRRRTRSSTARTTRRWRRSTGRPTGRRRSGRTRPRSRRRASWGPTCPRRWR